MAIVSRALLKSFFKKGSKPTQEHFESLIDSFVHVAEDNYKLGLHRFSKDTSYPLGATVIYETGIYKALVPTSAGVFKEAEWMKLGDASPAQAKEPAAQEVKVVTEEVKPAVEKKSAASKKATAVSIKEEPFKAAVGGTKWVKGVAKVANIKSAAGEKMFELFQLEQKAVVLGTFIKLPPSASKTRTCSMAVGGETDAEQFLPFTRIKLSADNEVFIEAQKFSVGAWNKEAPVYLTVKASATDKLSIGEVEVYMLISPVEV